jgi:uncharacterized membrane protein YgdD (TMEM256/DUF423 family)
MAQYEQQREEQPTTRQWMRVSIYSSLIGGVLTIISGIAYLSELTPAEFEIASPVMVIALALLAIALPSLYVSEHHWFGRLAAIGFWLMAVGWILAAIALPVADYLFGMAFLVAIIGWYVAFVGALVFGIAMLHTNAKTPPRVGAWLLIATLLVGTPFAYGFTTYVMGKIIDPWSGSFILSGLAWVVFGRYLLARETKPDVETPQTTAQ